MGLFRVSDVLGLLAELSSQVVKKYPTPAPPLIGSSTPMVPVDAPELIHIVKSELSEAVPDATPPRYTAVGCDEGSPLVWIVKRY